MKIKYKRGKYYMIKTKFSDMQLCLTAKIGWKARSGLILSKSSFKDDIIWFKRLDDQKTDSGYGFCFLSDILEMRPVDKKLAKLLYGVKDNE